MTDARKKQPSCWHQGGTESPGSHADKLVHALDDP